MNKIIVVKCTIIFPHIYSFNICMGVLMLMQKYSSKFCKMFVIFHTALINYKWDNLIICIYSCAKFSITYCRRDFI